MIAGHILIGIAVDVFSNGISGTRIALDLIYGFSGKSRESLAAGLIKRLCTIRHLVVEQIRHLAGGKLLRCFGYAALTFKHKRVRKEVAVGNISLLHPEQITYLVFSGDRPCAVAVGGAAKIKACQPSDRVVAGNYAGVVAIFHPLTAVAAGDAADIIDTVYRAGIETTANHPVAIHSDDTAYITVTACDRSGLIAAIFYGSVIASDYAAGLRASCHIHTAVTVNNLAFVGPGDTADILVGRRYITGYAQILDFRTGMHIAE